MPNTITLVNKNILYNFIKRRCIGITTLLFIKKYNNYKQCLIDYNILPSVIVDIIMFYINDKFAISFEIKGVIGSGNSYSNLITYSTLIRCNCNINFCNYDFDYVTKFTLDFNSNRNTYLLCNYYKYISKQILLYYYAKTYYSDGPYHTYVEFINNDARPNNNSDNISNLSCLIDSFDKKVNMTNRKITDNCTNNRIKTTYTIVNHNMTANMIVIIQLINKHINNILKQIVSGKN